MFFVGRIGDILFALDFNHRWGVGRAVTLNKAWETGWKLGNLKTGCFLGGTAVSKEAVARKHVLGGGG